MKSKFFKIIFSISLVLLVIGCENSIQKPSKSEVKAITKKVADWQIKTFEDQGKYRALPLPENQKKWHHRNRYHDAEWMGAALYAGMYEFSTITADPTYSKWLYGIGQKNNWKLYKRMHHADDHAVGQMYLNMQKMFGNHRLIKPLRNQFDSILNSDERDKWHWHWADALFMAPPVWARLAKTTKQQKYLEYMDEQYHKTYDALWDKEEHLFYRDKKYLDQKEENGKGIFWSRGNGWVFGGLALMIPDFPNDWDGKQFYVETFQQMAETLKNTQRKDGTWSSGILGGEKAYPTKEISGSAFFVFGLAWGINNGILNAEVYEPTLIKGWKALTECVTEDGLVGYIQPVGAAPGNSFPNYTELYGVGAFLAAGAEMYKYVEKIEDANSTKKEVSEFTTFMNDGGWCWYQDPRAIINNGKLVIGGLSGQSGDVKVSVYDLETNTNKGTVVLDKNFQADDHDVPALYARPDGSILSVWAKHGNEKIHHYNISSPSNYLEWNNKSEFKYDYNDNRGVTYMNLYYLENENNLYNFYRDGETYNPSFITSKDHGTTWGNRTHFIADDVEGRQRPYARYFQKDNNTVGVSFTDGHPRQYGNSLYYAEYRNGAFYNVDGSKIKDLKEPLRTPEAEKIYIGSETKVKPKGFESVPNSAWTCAMGKDSENNPHIGYSLYLSNNDHRYRIAAWDGKKWIDKEIAYAGTCLYTMESSYTGLMAFDPEDPTQVYISTDVNPSTGEKMNNIHEIYSAKIGLNDDISTIKWKAITSNSEYRNIRPIVVAGEGHKALIWLNGPWNSFVNYKADVKGIILSSKK
ncbi:Rhamnogalacturonyl hydrolase YesR [Lutibacter oricola]|uniref:Rhamnogalacturonyl hydrolase YesR n=1 Tax=Lutibacter oricola TaxID=762486 RepID=A0A1H2SS83_9FLAO|nr:glycoside hydrolase family 88 protein [Lutibacter oricola]SDW34387.1 Rhamnogalacturonyl hydrolase YesR [Lutibacter oricola]